MAKSAVGGPKKWVGLVVLCLLAASCRVAPTSQQLSAAELLAKARSGVVLVEGFGCEVRQQGSGTLVKVNGEQRLLTNRHIVADVVGLKVAGAVVSTSASVTSPTYDLASVSVGSAVTGPDRELEVASKDVVEGDQVTLIGYAAGARLLANKASVQLVSDGAVYGYSGDVLLLDGPSEPGFSGGPVIDAEGRVAGLLMGMDRSTGLAIAIPLETLLDDTTYEQMIHKAATCK